MIELEEELVELRPMMKITEMVSYLKMKNIKFDIFSEEKAEKYLRDNNNYYNVTAYKHNFERYFIEDKSTWHEESDPYYRFYETEKCCSR